MGIITLRLTGVIYTLAMIIVLSAKLVGQETVTDWLAFMSNRRLNPEIYAQDTRRYLSVQMTWGNDWADTPAWSNDGRLAYAANNTGDWEIYVLNPLTGQITNVTHDPDHNDYSPAWSADGRLAIVSSEPNQFGEISVLDIDAGTRLDTGKVGMNPAWSNDDRLAYAANYTGNWEIYVYDILDDTVLNVTNDASNDWSPSWSADGRLAFMSSRTRNLDIFVLDLQTGETLDVTNNPSDDLYPKWSFDGRLAFMSSRAGNAEIYVLDLETGLITNMTNNPLYDTSPAWTR